MNTEITDNTGVRRDEETHSSEKRECVFYDGGCLVCCRGVARWRGALEPHGFTFVPQQDEIARQKLGLRPGEVFPEIKLLTREGKLLGGMEAILHLVRFIWWLRPLRLFGKLPGGMWILRRGYRWFADRRYCFNGICKLPKK